MNKERKNCPWGRSCRTCITSYWMTGVIRVNSRRRTDFFELAADSRRLTQTFYSADLAE